MTPKADGSLQGTFKTETGCRRNRACNTTNAKLVRSNRGSQGYQRVLVRVGETTGLDRQLEGTTTGRKWAEVGVDLVRSIFQQAWHIKPFVDDDDFWTGSKSRGEVTGQIPQHPLARSTYDLWLPSLVASKGRGGRTWMTLSRLHHPAGQPLVLAWCASPALVCPAAPVLSCS